MLEIGVRKNPWPSKHALTKMSGSHILGIDLIFVPLVVAGEASFEGYRGGKLLSSERRRTTVATGSLALSAMICILCPAVSQLQARSWSHSFGEYLGEFE